MTDALIKVDLNSLAVAGNFPGRRLWILSH
jgi:hypothetical protein